MSFFPDPPEPTENDEPSQPVQADWVAAPEDVLPGVVPVELVIGQSESTAVLLTGIRAFPTGLAMTLGIRLRAPLHRGRDLHSEVFDGPYGHDMDATWQAHRLKWGSELADGQRVTNVDRSWSLDQPRRDIHRSLRGDDQGRTLIVGGCRAGR